jgi:hypothetical protein
MECESLEFQNIFQNFKILKIFYHVEMGCHVHDMRSKILFYDAKIKIC